MKKRQAKKFLNKGLASALINGIHQTSLVVVGHEVYIDLWNGRRGMHLCHIQEITLMRKGWVSGKKGHGGYYSLAADAVN